MDSWIHSVVLLCCLHFQCVVGDYECICNYNVEKSVLPAPDLTTQPLGYLYEFDCKPSVQATNVDKSNWQSVAFEHEIGYVAVDSNIQAQICQGSPSSFDIITTTTTTTQSTTQTTTTTTKSTTLPTTTPNSTTTSKLTAGSSTPMSTFSTTKPTTKVTTPKPTTSTMPNLTTPTTKTSKPTTKTTTTKPTTKTTTPQLPTTTTTHKPTTRTTTPKSTTKTTTPKPTTKPTTPKPTTETTTPKPTTKTSTPKPTTKTTTPKPTTETTTPKPTTPKPTTKITTPKTTTETTTPKPTSTTRTTLPPTTVDPIRGNTFLCPAQVKANSKADRTPLGQHRISCYELIMTYKSSWNNTETKCKQRGGHLVDINDADEQKFITKFLQNFTPNHAVWIGLNDVKSEGSFSWSSGSALTYSNWYPEHSDHFLSHNVEDCAVVIPYRNGQWDDLPCLTYHNTPVNYPAFCEYKIPQ